MDLFQKYVIEPVRYCIDVFVDRNAFYIAGEYYTYRQFGEAVDVKRAEICDREENIIPLEIRDDLETYATIFACWFENKAYVPINPTWPTERKENILGLLKNTPLPPSRGDGEEESPSRVDGGEESPSRGDEGEDLPSRGNGKGELAYILFTSGSTGVPKGVAISRKNVGAFMDSFWKTGITIDENDRCLQCFDLTFDVSIQSFLVALTRGACVYTVPYNQVKYLSVASLIHEQHITFGAMAPSILTYLRPYFSELDASAFKTCILTAEACPVDLIEEWQQCAKNVEVYDFYGPTEATVYCTYYKCSADNNLSVNGMVSIGKPMANVTAVIVDEERNIITEDGVKGELWVAGDQVTQGYWNNEEKNREVFSYLEVDGKNKRFYHTGDLCYWDVSGNIMYVGRIDQQVKVQGFRVELSEIEYHARSFYQNEARVAAIAYRNEHQLHEIALFVEKTAEPSDSLISYLKEKMPQYMMPSRVIYLDRFPQNSSDKIDRWNLRQILKDIKRLS